MSRRHRSGVGSGLRACNARGFTTKVTMRTKTGMWQGVFAHAGPIPVEVDDQSYRERNRQ